MQKVANLISRVLLAQLFLVAGLSKVTGYTGTQQYMAAMGVPGALLPLVIVLEIGGALALIVGWQTRWTALALAGFSVLSALLFHFNLGDQMQSIQFMKNLAIAGGLLALAVPEGQATLSLDHYLKRAGTLS